MSKWRGIMKSRMFFFLLLTCIMTILVLRCSDGVTEYNVSDGRYLSYESKGCIAQSSLAKVKDGASVSWTYSEGTLRLELLFTTLCSAKMKDSVVFVGNFIMVYLGDTNRVASLCVCPHKEIFNFRAQAGGRLKLAFYFRQYSKIEYHLLADTTIYLVANGFPPT